VKPWPLQAFCPLQAFFAPLQALCPLQALAPVHFTWADADVATKVLAANTAAAVAKTVFVFMICLPVPRADGIRRKSRNYSRADLDPQCAGDVARWNFTRLSAAFCIDH
jgi:hypothetical protein